MVADFHAPVLQLGVTPPLCVYMGMLSVHNLDAASKCSPAIDHERGKTCILVFQLLLCAEIASTRHCTRCSNHCMTNVCQLGS
jgi:hypothetical protein